MIWDFGKKDRVIIIIRRKEKKGRREGGKEKFIIEYHPILSSAEH